MGDQGERKIKGPYPGNEKSRGTKIKGDRIKEDERNQKGRSKIITKGIKGKSENFGKEIDAKEIEGKMKKLEKQGEQKLRGTKRNQSENTKEASWHMGT